jgi:hypothetical protein
MANKRNLSGSKYLKTALAIWGGSLGFTVGAALTAWLAKLLGWWPASPEHLLKYVKNNTHKDRDYV